MRADGELVSAEDLLNRVSDEHADPFTPDPIVTVVGRGYRLR